MDENRNIFVGEKPTKPKTLDAIFDKLKDMRSFGKVLEELWEENKSLKKQLARLEFEATQVKKFALVFNYKERRLKAKLKLRDVEKLTGISNSYMSQLETGKMKNPSYEVVSKLNELYAQYES